MKNLAISITFLFFANAVLGQKKVSDTLKPYYQDSLIITKKFKDGPLSNNLRIKVINPCDPAKEKFDGAVTMIEAVLKNKNYSDSVIYKYPDAQSGLINFREKNISVCKISGKQAILIPFSYCGNFDNDTKISYILFYDHKKYLYHINYKCGEDLKCKVKDDLNSKLKDLPLKLRTMFVKQLETKFKNAEDF